MKTKEIVSMIMDLAKNISDDSVLTEDHVIFLANKHRALILKKEYELIKKEHNQLNMQTICVDLETCDTEMFDGCDGQYLVSKQDIPDIIDSAKPIVSAYNNIYSYNIVFVSYNKMKYVNVNKFLRNIIYCCLNTDNKLYLKSSNPQFANLEQIQFTAVFDDFEKTLDYQCNNNEDDLTCDIMDVEFPLQPDLVPVLINQVLKDIVSAQYRPADKANNSSDDLSSIENFIRQNVKSPLSKQLENVE